MKQKKVLAMLLTLMLAFSLTACGGDTQEEEPAETEETTAEPEEEETQEEEEEPEESEPAGTGEADISSAVDSTTTTDTEPVPLGQWTNIADYATEDEAYHTVYVRVNQVTTSTDDAEYVQSAVNLHNESSSDFMQIDLASVEIPDDVEWCVLDYEVYVPAEFPGPEYGITEPSMDFSETNVGGGGFPAGDGSTYIGLGTNNTDLATVADPSYQPGNTYSFRTLFTMVKGYQDYVFELTAYPDGTTSDTTSADIMYYVYFANK